MPGGNKQTCFNEQSKRKLKLLKLLRKINSSSLMEFNFNLKRILLDNIVKKYHEQ